MLKKLGNVSAGTDWCFVVHYALCKMNCAGEVVVFPLFKNVVDMTTFYFIEEFESQLCITPNIVQHY